jgi:hypothetical protein
MVLIRDRTIVRFFAEHSQAEQQLAAKISPHLRRSACTACQKRTEWHLSNRSYMMFVIGDGQSTLRRHAGLEAGHNQCDRQPGNGRRLAASIESERAGNAAPRRVV